MTTRYHSTSGVLSLNIQLTRSAGANNSPCPNLSYHPTIKTTDRNYYFISSPDNRCSYLIIRLSLFPSSCKEGCSSWFPSLVLHLPSRLFVSSLCFLSTPLLLRSSVVPVVLNISWLLFISNLLFTHN